MKLRSITFRCSETQYQRINRALASLDHENRTELISKALAEFLDFVEQGDVQGLTLAQLVSQVDETGCRHAFAEQS